MQLPTRDRGPLSDWYPTGTNCRETRSAHTTNVYCDLDSTYFLRNLERSGINNLVAPSSRLIRYDFRERKDVGVPLRVARTQYGLHARRAWIAYESGWSYVSSQKYRTRKRTCEDETICIRDVVKDLELQVALLPDSKVFFENVFWCVNKPID